MYYKNDTLFTFPHIFLEHLLWKFNINLFFKVQGFCFRTSESKAGTRPVIRLTHTFLLLSRTSWYYQLDIIRYSIKTLGLFFTEYCLYILSMKHISCLTTQREKIYRVINDLSVAVE